MRDKLEGPTWHDCAELIEGIRDRWAAQVEVNLVQQGRRFDGRGLAGWVAQVVVRSRSLEGHPPVYAQASFGAGGGWKTAPAAIHWALQRADAVREASAIASQGELPF